MVDQTIGLRELLQKVSTVITKCSKFSDYKMWQILLQITGANLLKNGKLSYKNVQVL